MFSNKELRSMIITLFFEQLLVMLVGIVDTFVVSSCGEAAVSGVSLVNQFNTIFIYLFTALASGGAIVVSQYIGNKDEKRTILSSSQLLMFSIVFSIILSILVLIFNKQLLGLLFGKVESDVMKACVTYLRISAYSYPALAIYNAGAALYRSMAKTKVTMYISFAANIINVVGNIIGVYVLKAGVAGVAYPSLISRVFSAIIITVLCFNKKLEAYYDSKDIFKFDGKMLKRILNIAIPNGVENGMFGTYQIAANGVAQSIWSLAALVGSAMGSVFITVIGQCMGAKDVDQAKFYFSKLIKWSLVFSIVWNVLVLAITPFILQFYNLADETKHLIITLVIIHNIANTVVFPLSGPLSQGLRATGDVKFTMIVSIASTVGGRLVLSIILALGLHLGVIGIALAMCGDWTIRAIIFYYRYKSNAWTEFEVI